VINGNGAERLGELEYAELVARVQATVARAVPPGSSVLVVSKGDAALLEQPGHTLAHFPQDVAGGYAGHHPRDSAEATLELERLRRHGAEYLVIPATARWWLDFYEDFARHLANHGQIVADVTDSCLVYGLGPFAEDALEVPTIGKPRASIDQMRDYLENLISNDSSMIVLEDGDGLAAGLAPLRVTRLGVRESAGEGDIRLFAELKHRAVEGADYLVVPRSADDWLDCHVELAEDIEASCRKIADQGYLCRVFELEGLREGT
jgi:hypothetical protein